MYAGQIVEHGPPMRCSSIRCTRTRAAASPRCRNQSGPAPGEASAARQTATSRRATWAVASPTAAPSRSTPASRHRTELLESDPSTRAVRREAGVDRRGRSVASEQPTWLGAGCGWRARKLLLAQARLWFGTAESSSCVYGCIGCWSTSSVGPCSTICPAYLTSPRRRRSGRSRCRASRTERDLCISLRSSIRFRMPRRIETSSIEIGSSARITFGSTARARAMATRWRCPPESCAGTRRDLLLGDEPTELSSSMTRVCTSWGTMLWDPQRAREVVLESSSPGQRAERSWKIICTCER